jgi:hypothetical protein
MLAATLVAPGHDKVIPLPPEFITPQDGAEKQDCENNAAKRWLAAHSRRYAAILNPIYLGDDLFSRQPLCEAVLKTGGHFIFVCKPSSHSTIEEYLAGIDLPSVEVTVKRGKERFIHRHRWLCDLPLRGGNDALRVNWFEIQIINPAGKTTYRNSFVTDLPVSPENIVELAACGRARWKIENETFNVLKNNGYNLEHNFGHGKINLAATLASLNLLAFAFHTACDIADQLWQNARQKLGPRYNFFSKLAALTAYLIFTSWDDLLLTLAFVKPRRYRRPDLPQNHSLKPRKTSNYSAKNQNENRWLPAAHRPRTKTKRRRTTPELRDNQEHQHRVAPRQSTANLRLARDNHTDHHPKVAGIDPHPDCRRLSSRSSRYTATEKRPILAGLSLALKPRIEAFGVPSAAPRLVTLRSAELLLADLCVSTDALTTIVALADADLATSEAAVGRCLGSAADLRDAIGLAPWDIISAAAGLTDQRQVAAEGLRARTRGTLEADEHAEPLRPVLKDAQTRASRLLAETVPTVPPVVPTHAEEPTSPLPRPMPIGEELVEERQTQALDADDALVVIEDLRTRLSTTPGAKLTFGWRLTRPRPGGDA